MSQLPLPIRIAVGLVATAVEQTRELPRRALELPVTAMSQALQMSMRIQQKVTELAIKGDTVLSRLRPLEDQPSWARFDDEEPTGTGTGTLTDLRPRDRTRATTSEEPATTAKARGSEPDRAATVAGPDVLPEYPNLTVPQLRGRLRYLSPSDLRALLEWEKAHENRPVYVTMLSNRIATVTQR